MRILLLGLLAIGSVWGQFPLTQLLPLIRDYLTLTEVQVKQIQRQNAAYEEWLEPNYVRMVVTLPFEIAAETGREVLDGAAIGARYAEIEKIRREIAARRLALIADNLRVLNETQREKMKALEAAMRLADTGAQAEAFLLMPNRCRDEAATAESSIVQDPLGGIRHGNSCSLSLQQTGGLTPRR